MICTSKFSVSIRINSSFFVHFRFTVKIRITPEQENTPNISNVSQLSSFYTFRNMKNHIQMMNKHQAPSTEYVTQIEIEKSCGIANVWVIICHFMCKMMETTWTNSCFFCILEHQSFLSLWRNYYIKGSFSFSLACIKFY